MSLSKPPNFPSSNEIDLSLTLSLFNIYSFKKTLKLPQIITICFLLPIWRDFPDMMEIVYRYLNELKLYSHFYMGYLFVLYLK